MFKHNTIWYILTFVAVMRVVKVFLDYKPLLDKFLTISNGVIIKGYVHICGSHLSFGVRLTHVL